MIDTSLGFQDVFRYTKLIHQIYILTKKSLYKIQLDFNWIFNFVTRVSFDF